MSKRDRATSLAHVCFVLSSAALTSSCGMALDEVWQLREFRVLGVRLDPPEVDRGATVRATLLTVDTTERPVRTAWIVSAFPIQPATSRPSAAPSDAPTIAVCATEGAPFLGCPPGFQCACGTSPQFRVPPTGGLVGSTGKETLSVLGFTCAGGEVRLGADPTNPFTCQGDGSRGWYFTRTILVRPTRPVTEPNTNPEIREVRFGLEGMPTALLSASDPPRVPACADSARVPTFARPSTCSRYNFEVLFEDGSRQAYNDVDPIAMSLVPRQERLSVGFVVSAGRLDAGFRTDSEVDPESRMANLWAAPDAPARVRLIIYAADRRGGFASTERAVIVE